MNKLYEFVDYIFPFFLLFYLFLLPLFFIISGLSFRSTLQLQNIVALCSVILTIVFVFMKIVYNIQKGNDKYRIVATAIFFLFGTVFPVLVLINSKNWVWQENLFVGIILALIVFTLYWRLSVSPAEWRRPGSISKVRGATYKESLQAFGRDPLMVCAGIMFAGFIFYFTWEFSSDGKLFLTFLIDTISK
jgi:hypothetical protein